ncbi:hypothetical protein ACH5RR_024155 [Cinchona calisaya]|uniref:Uncharacterized protein n=1 Tax=Cinchona calisaya TaxID=153742 RepID=A0ABD2ZDU1_9GENT
MELKNLNSLIERTWDLHIRMNERIHYESVSFCKQCLFCCGIAETKVEERRRLIAIRDSLKDFQDMLVFVQTLESSKQQHENAAFARLEASRLLLVEKINQFPVNGKEVDVLEELNIWCLFNPWNWYKTAKMAIKLVVVSTLVSSSIDVYRSRQHFIRPPKKILWPKDRQMIAGKTEFLLKDDSISHIDVVQGRG